MCPVCGTLLQLAESPQAQRERVFINRLIDEGRSEEEVKDALVAEYGDEVLALPPELGLQPLRLRGPDRRLPDRGGRARASASCAGAAAGRAAAGAGPRCGPSGEDAERLDADLARYDL